MHASSRIVSKSVLGALVSLAGAGSYALAQDCRLSVGVNDSVLTAGESTGVHVRAHFPWDGYAFASSVFDVFADIPSWTFASAGVIAGPSVQGIMASQQHNPFNGILADPSNPLRIWTGNFTPDSYAPRAVQVRAVPLTFAYYPSELTSSSVSCSALPGRKWIFINPLSVGMAIAAPGDGTSLGTSGDDVLIGGGNDHVEILVGMLLPAIQAVRMEPGNPDDLTIGLDFGDGVPLESVTYGFTKIEYRYSVRATWPHAERYAYRLFNGATMVGEYRSADGLAPFVLERLPDVEHSIVRDGGNSGGQEVVTQFAFDGPIRAVINDSSDVFVTRVEVVSSAAHVAGEPALETRYFRAAGSDEMRLRLGTLCRGDFNRDFVIDSRDFFDFLVAFFANSADIDGNGVTDSQDFFEFLAAYFAGC